MMWTNFLLKYSLNQKCQFIPRSKQATLQVIAWFISIPTSSQPGGGCFFHLQPKASSPGWLFTLAEGHWRSYCDHQSNSHPFQNQHFSNFCFTNCKIVSTISANLVFHWNETFKQTVVNVSSSWKQLHQSSKWLRTANTATQEGCWLPYCTLLFWEISWCRWHYSNN